MIARKMVLAAAVAAVGAVGLAAQSTSADTVVAFKASGDDVTWTKGGSSIAISFVGTAESLTFSPDGTQPNVDFGTFHVAVSGNATFDFNGLAPGDAYTFVLDITQSAPPDAGSVSSEPITGKIQVNPSHGPEGSIIITFDDKKLTLPTSGNLPSVTYSNFHMDPVSLGAGGNAELYGDVTYSAVAVPLPAAVWGGASLLGMLGVARLRKSRA